ncbi:MAG: hypothetical protein WA183_00650 [Chthoniobacterales bacterium]
MKKSVVTLLLVPFTLLAQSISTSSDTEEPPLLSAKIILKPEFVAGDGFAVQDEVPTSTGRNRYLIVSEYGEFEGDGNIMLERRIKEVAAIRKLKEVSRTDEYKNALKAAAAGPLVVAKDVVTNPVGTITGVPKGLFKFVNRAGQSLKEKTQRRERSQYEDSSAAGLIGFSKAKRRVAIQLGVDPYSSNETLQRELNGIAWATFAGKMTFSLATAPIGGAAGMALTGAGITNAVNKALLDQAPADLRLRNLKVLLAMGCDRAVADRFINDTAFSPSVQTAIVMDLETLNGVANRAAFVDLAGSGATDEGDALFFLGTSRVLAELHAKKPLARLQQVGRIPVAVRKDGRAIVAIQWDYAAWTDNAANFIGLFKASDFGKKPSGLTIAISGDASPLAQQKLKNANIELVTRIAPGPLR